MNKNVIKAVVLTVALTFSSIGYVDAKRMGGGKSFGRTAPVQKQAQPAPVQKPAQQAQSAAPAASPAAAAPKRSGFGGMLGGLAAGLGIAYLLSHFGLGEAAASLFTGLLMALAAGLILMFILKRFMPSLSGAGRANPSAAGNGMQRTHLDQSARQEPAYTPAATAFGGVAASAPVAEKALPPGFDEYAFLDNAKHYFVKLQKAWDDGDLDSLREFATPEMFNTLTQDLNARADSANQTDVVTLNAELLGVETGQDSYLASIEFTGMIREQVGAPATPFTEIWNLSKPTHGSGGWVLAGIQQLV
ncbi:MAG: Tim44-like domain-containing protein [Polynucleobacter sp.]|nr:Tim44-like domain-containing protein [Polynucleobacter sp.]